MKAKMIVVSIAVAAVISGGLIYNAQNQQSKTQAQAATAAPAPTVPVAEVITHELRPTAEYTGYLSAPQSVELRSRIGGVIERVSVPEGSYVQKGQTLFKIDPEPFQLALDIAQARLKAIDVQYKQAIADFNRANQLLASGAVSKKIYDDALATKNNRQAQVQEAHTAVDEAKLNLSYTNIKAPISGRVDRVLVTAGNLITGGNTSNTTLLTSIVSVNPLYVYFDLDEATLLKLKEQNKQGLLNLPIAMGLANTENHPYLGQLNFISNQVDQRTGTIRVRASVENKQGELSSGMFARIQLTTGANYPAILIDDQAVGSDQDKNYVLILGAGNKVEYRPVKLGAMFNGLRIIDQGLKSGEKIILKGLVGPGMQVNPNIVPMQDNTQQAKVANKGEK